MAATVFSPVIYTSDMIEGWHQLTAILKSQRPRSQHLASALKGKH